ncbi:MAG: choice-of-anchor V domain-containing protein [Bryobacteraceae bacterium]
MIIGASQTAPPVGKTGAPGDGSCAECHSGAANNPGAIVLNVESLGYVPNRKQTISVNIYRRNNPVLAGFQLTARLSTNGQAGSFEAGDNTLVQVKDGIQYVSHKGPHVPDDHTNEPHFKFSWTPPGPGAGEVTFYAMAVVGEANGTPEGNVYKSVVPYRMATNDMPPGYRWQSFTVPGAIETHPHAISSNGTITGSYWTGTLWGSFLRQPSGEIRKLNLPFVRDYSINAQGTITATADDIGTLVRDPDGRITYFSLPGARHLRLAGISDTGTLAGDYSAANFYDTLFTKSGNEVRTYSIRDSYNYAFGITSSGMPYSGKLGEKYAGAARNFSGQESGGNSMKEKPIVHQTQSRFWSCARSPKGD